MRRVLLFMGAFFLCSFAHSQIINEDAAWPNGSWALNGTYDNASLLANPTADANFSYDDDNAGSGSTDILDAESNVIDISSAVSGGETFLTVTFDYNYNFGSTFNLEWYDADASTWTTWDAIADNSSTTSDWCGNISGSFTSSELDVAAFTATQQSGFQYRLHYDASSVWGWGFCIASPTITSSAPPSCPDPSNLTASNITDMSADFDWTQGGSAVDFTLEVCPDGTAAGDPSCISTTTGTLGGTVTVNGLTAYTAYDAYITEDCGGNGTSSVVGPEEFTTTGPNPVCGGKFYDVGGPSNEYPVNYDEIVTICPDVPGEVVTVTFLSFDTESCCDDLEVFNGDNTSATSIGTFAGTTIPGPFTSTDATGCLTFEFSSDISIVGDGWDADVTCAPPPTCPNPSNLIAGNITDMSADFDWTTGGSATGFTLEVCPDGTPAGDPSCITTTIGTIGGTVTVSGLSPSTDYDAYLTEDCGGANGQSSTLGPIDITTNAAPPANDDCGSAINIMSLPYSNSQDASAATQANFLTTCVGMNDGVWYTMDGTGCDVTVMISPTTSWDPELGVYSGSCGAFTCVDNSDSGFSGGDETITFYAEVGTTYYFNIGHYSSSTNGSEGPFDISVECCDALSTVAEPSSTATLTQANSCTETNGFTYYSDGTNNIFAIDWDPSDIGGGHNSAAKTGVSITVTTNAPGVATDNPSGQGTWTMQTYWNVDAPALDGPVSIKFFYNPIDKDATDDAAANSGLGPIETPTWFKTVGVDFDPANITAGSVGQGSIPLSASIGTENGATFARFDNITSFSGGTYAAGVGVSGQSVLPIDLLSIDAQAVKDGNQITWTTAREQNVEVHIIEKSKDGRTWDVLQEVDAKNSASKTSYRIVDEDPYYMTHYRLSSRDNDGSQYISGYASVERSGENDLSVFPNPFAGSLRLSANSTIEQNISIQITDLQGRVLVTDNNSLTVGRQEIKIDTESLPSGVYLIHINGESISSTEKIVKY